jgi:hypothetical protein
MSRDQDIALFGAVEQSDGSYRTRHGTKSWYNKEGRLHRDDGPAIIYTDGYVSWWLNGERYTYKEWFRFTPITDETKLLVRLQYE